MKKFIFLSFIFLFLAACTPKAYTENLEVGKTALKEEKYSDAVKSLTIALNEKETEEVKRLLHLAELMNESINAYNEGNYEASIYTSKKVKELKGHSKLEEDVILKASSIINVSEEAIEKEEEIQENVIKGKTLLDQNKFDEAYAIFEKIANDKTVMELESNKSVRNEISNLMNETIDKKKAYLEEQEKKRQDEEKKRKEAEEQAKLEAEQKAKEEERKRQEEENKPLTHEQAIELVKQYINYQPNPNVHVAYDHDNENGDYVIQVYEVVIDDPDTKEGHTATWGWYAVDPVNKYVYDNMNY